MGNASALCRKKPQTSVIQAQTINETVHKKKEIRNGFCRIYTGVRHDDKKYTSPVLALHTWAKDSSSTRTHGATIGVAHQQGGMFSAERSNSVLTSTNQRREEKFALDETIQMIPIEDIISISAETAVKRAVAQAIQRRVKTPPPEDLSCGAKTKKWCMTSVCCCCCTPTVAPAQIVETSREEQSASRTIIVTLKHVVHSNVHTPSNVQVLGSEKQNKFYQDKFEEETIKFYYLHNDEVNEANFNSKMREAETLARMVTQIKAMKPHYPDSGQLTELLKQQEVAFFGFESNEHMTNGASQATGTRTNTTTQHDARDS